VLHHSKFDKQFTSSSHRAPICDAPTEISVKISYAAATFEIFYREVLDSNLVRDTRYAHSGASWFFSATPVQYHDSTSIRSWQLSSTSFPFHYPLIALPLDATHIIWYTDSIKNKSRSRFFTYCCSYMLEGKQFNGAFRYKKVYYKQVSIISTHSTVS